MESIAARGETTAYEGARFWMYCGALDHGGLAKNTTAWTAMFNYFEGLR